MVWNLTACADAPLSWTLGACGIKHTVSDVAVVACVRTAEDCSAVS